MGKSVNMNNLTPEEAEQILKVIQKDFELRSKEKERLSKIEEDVAEEEAKTTILAKQRQFNENCCIRCCVTFGFIFNRKQMCQACRLFVCKACSHYDDHLKGYVCRACLKEVDLKLKSFEWFYSNASRKFKRVGSAKVVRDLYKHFGERKSKAHSDNESDSGYDPSFYSSFGQSGSIRVKSRPPLTAVFPDININDQSGEQFDNVIPPPPLQSPNGNSFPTSPTPTPTDNAPDNKEKEKRDIYREAFENTKRTEEAKFKLRFDNLMSDMQVACDKLSQQDGRMPTDYGSASYGEVMSNYRARIKDLLVSLSQRLELAIESFDDSSPHSAMGTSQKVRLLVSKLIEDRLGESLDLTSDEAVSDLSSLSDESGELKSFEDQVAQAVVAKMLEMHRKESGVHLQLQDEPEPMDQQTDSSASEEKIADRTMSSSASEEKHVLDSVQSETKEKNNNDVEPEQKESVVENGNEDIPDGVQATLDSALRAGAESPVAVETDSAPRLLDETEIVQREFAKLRSMAMDVTPRPLYEEVQMTEVVEEEPINETFERVIVDHEESQDEFASRMYTYDRVNDPEGRGLPDFSDLDYEYHDFGINEVDPDLLSMNLAPILEETEEDLEQEEQETDPDYEQDWRGNWMFKGGAGLMPYDSMGKPKMASELSDIYMGIPKEHEGYNAPQIGNKDADELSDMSENDDRDSLDGMSDEENSFYAKTSEEIARITRTSTSSQASAMANMSAQTDDSDMESLVSRQMSSSFSDSARPERDSFESKSSSVARQKLSEELVPSENNDPKFEIPPDSVTVPEGEPAKFMCRVAGTPQLEVLWYRVRDDLEELEDGEKYEIIKEGNRHHITMFNLTQADAGQYMCITVNDSGRCCQYFILTLKKNKQDMKTPEFLRDIHDVEVTEGESVKFRCKVKGYPQPRVIWYKDGQILRSGINCRLERFGNRDYILAIDTASMDEDAEYSVIAKNIAGEVKSSAQLIVEPKSKPESAPATPKLVEKPTSPKADPTRPVPTWLRSRAGVSPSSRKQDQNLSNLSQKVSMTKDSIAKEAEDMLHSTKELTEIDKSIQAMDQILAELESDIYSNPGSDDLENNNDIVVSLGDVSEFEVVENYHVLKDAAENVRKVTSAALDILNSTDSLVLNNTSSRDQGILATSTPRSSDTERAFSPVSDVLPQLDVENNLVSPSSEEKHKTEFSFSFNPVQNKNAQNRDAGSAARSRSTPGKGVSNSGAKSSETGPAASPNKPKVSISKQSSGDSGLPALSDTSASATDSRDSSFDSREMPVSDSQTGPRAEPESSEHIRINLGPKRENKTHFTRDYYVTNTPQPVRRNIPAVDTKKEEVKVKPEVRATVESPAKKEVERAHTEEKIYLAAANVNTLESSVQSLQDKVRAVNALAERDKMSRLEDQVARTAAKVSITEKDVKSIEHTVHKLNAPKPGADNSPARPPASGSSRTPHAPVTTATSPPRPKPEQTTLKGHTMEQDIPESRTEFNEDYGAAELPSVNRLKAMFSSTPSHSSKDSSIKRIHSITARSVPKEQLEKLRRTEDSAHPHPSSPRTVASHHAPVSPGRATVLTTGQQIKVTPSEPKQVFQSSSVRDSSETHAPTKTQQKQPPVTIKLSSGSHTNRPLSPVQSEHKTQTKQPIRAHNPGKSSAPKAPEQSDSASSTAVKSGDQIDTPEGRRSPKIRSGVISAMSKLWEKRLTEGGDLDFVPDIVDSD